MQRYVIALDTEDGDLLEIKHPNYPRCDWPYTVFVGALEEAEQEMLKLVAKGTTCYLCVLRTVMTYKGKKLT